MVQQPAACYLVHNNSHTLAIAAAELDTWSGDNGNFIQTRHFHTIIMSENTISISHNNMICSALAWPGIGSCQFLLYKADFMSGFRFCQISESVNNAAMTWCLDKCLKISSSIISPSISAFQCVDDTWCLNTKCHAREPVTFQQFLTKATSAIKSISRKYFNYLVKYLHKMQWNASAQVYLKFLMVMGKRSTAWLWTGVMLNLTGKQSWWNLTTELRPTDGTQIRCLLPPAARNWFLLQVSDGGWLARGDDIVFCNGMFHQQMATTFITFIFGGRISTKVSCYL